MIRRPPRSTRTDTLFPYTTLFRSKSGLVFGSGDVLALALIGFARVRMKHLINLDAECLCQLLVFVSRYGTFLALNAADVGSTNFSGDGSIELPHTECGPQHTDIFVNDGASDSHGGKPQPQHNQSS